MDTFHFTEIIAVRVELLIPGFSCTKLCLVSLLHWRKQLLNNFNRKCLVVECDYSTEVFLPEQKE